MTSITLSQLSEYIQQSLKGSIAQTFWLRAEISELRENYNGHCYLELIEKSEVDDSLLAKIKASIWANNYRLLKPYFESETGEKLRAGIKILVSVSLDFHPVYGLAVNIRDIEPAFTIGELAARRMQVIKQLEADGIIDMNKQLPLALLPQRIAVISSATAAGYDDFCNQLHNNSQHFVFYSKLFNATMQGDNAEASIIAALEKVYQHIEHFDAVVIIRGGGATTDMSCFDRYELAANCAQFPLPLIVGIGHQRDSSVLDMVAGKSVKTPTAAAEFLIEQMTKALNEALWRADAICNTAKNIVYENKNAIERKKFNLKMLLRNKILRKQQQIELKKNKLEIGVKNQINTQRNSLSIKEKIIEMHSPSFMLSKGYTITTINGKRISSVKDVKVGEKIRTFAIDGDFTSTITE